MVARAAARRTHCRWSAEVAWPGGRTSSPTPGPMRDAKRRRVRLHVFVAGLWIALSLLLVGYATIRGEVALAELDGIDLAATYSLGSPAPPVDKTR
jgi:hypothetical protein